MRIRRYLLPGLAAVALVVSATPAGAGERMTLTCDAGTLAGHTLERTNGSSWWDTVDGTVYTTRSFTVSEQGQVVHAKDFGRQPGEPETCSGTHAAPGYTSTWDVELMRASR